HMSLPHRIVSGLAAALLAGGTALALAAPASATSTSAAATPTPALLCSGSSCDGQDPAATGCDATASTVDSIPTSFGTIDLRFSSACQTNWVRITGYPGGGTSLCLDVADLDRNVVIHFCVPTPISAGTHFGNMVFSPAQNCAEGAVLRNGVQIGGTL